MEVNLDLNKFEPKKGKKRRINSTGDSCMAVETHNGIEGCAKNKPRKPKRMRVKSESDGDQELRKVPVPAHRYTPLKENWLKIFTPIVEHLRLQVRFNLKTRNVEIRTCKETTDIANLQKGADFVKVWFMFLLSPTCTNN